MFWLKVLIFLAASRIACLASDTDTAKRFIFDTDDAWSNWSACTKSCGGGHMSRHLLCHHSDGASYECGTEVHSCETQHCPVTATMVAHWAEWSSCSATCGIGESVRRWICSTQITLGGRRSTCLESLERRTCSSGSCPIDGYWGSWSEWSKCPVTCVTQPQIRIRACNNPAPSNGGRQCEGSPTESQNCSNSACHVDGNWGSWSELSKCTVSCGTGTQVRVRSCANPAPSNGGLNCLGLSMEAINCSFPVCVKDPHVCDKVRLFSSIFHNDSVSQNGDMSCPDSSYHSSRVLIQELCKAPSTSLQFGSKVLDVCTQVPNFTPVGKYDDITGHTFFGIFIECHGNKLKVAIQDCKRHVHITDLDGMESDMYHVVNW